VLSHPATKYKTFPAIDLPNRQWPTRSITKPPIWMSTDLRDGNQSLFEPMNAERKMRMFRTLLQVGFKEIEVGFPSASQTDFDFVRELIEGGHVPDDVTIEVLTQSREHLIRRTIESLKGARRAIVHVYNATAPVFRDVVFGMSKPEVKELAVSSVRLIKEITATMPNTEWVLQYSPEVFTSTELEFACEVCDAVTAEWGATPANKVILNLPATVEVSTPNIYADQIEWMHTHLARRDSVTLSLHPHNDRGTGVAAAELGNTQGVSPGLDFSDINAIARTVEHCNQLPIHPRHPYVGDLVFTAFSGSHQDAIKKGFAAQKAAGPDAMWNVPYMPIDPADVGRSYDSVIRVNSQSGKGGVAYLMEAEFGVVMPRRLQVEFSGEVQSYTDSHGGEMSAQDIWNLFDTTYLNAVDVKVRYVEHHLFDHLASSGKAHVQGIRIGLEVNGQPMLLSGEGNGPIDAAVHALQTIGVHVHVRSFEERSTRASTEGGDAQACAFLELVSGSGGDERFGVGMDTNIVTASVKALISGVNRLGLGTAVPAQAAHKAA